MKSIDHERLESVLLDAILSGGSLQELFDRVYECIKLPLVCFDTTFHVLAYAFPRPFYYSHWEDMAERGNAAESAIIGYNYLEYQEKMYEHGRSQLFDSGTCEGYPQACGPVMADGRLAWRVMNNLLSNAVKYAMPGTRLYVDLSSLDGKVVLSVKNISRDELNIDADELMERFVRGDGSRNTEGSGLGLNIAKSLMELQRGQLELLVDGDLFKVTLIFPGVPD